LKIVFFSPNSGIWLHAFPEALLAESLEKQGHEIFYMTCDKVFQNYCITMSANGLGIDSAKEEREKICLECNQKRDFTMSRFGFKSENISAYLTEKDFHEASELIQIKKINSLFEYKESSIPIGKIASYETLLRFKKKSLNFNYIEENFYRTNFFNTILSKRASDRWLESLQPDTIITYNSCYSINRAVEINSINRNIPVYTIHAGEIFGDRLSRLMITKFNLLENSYHIKRQFNELNANTFFNIVTVNDYLLQVKELFAGNHFLAYSAGVESSVLNVREYFGIATSQKVLLATLSSYDEMIAGEITELVKFSYKGVYQTQIDWLLDLIEFVRNKDEYFLIVRVHPREFPNKRENRFSGHGQMIKETLVNLPKNCRVNLPDDNISLYALALETNLLLNAWSSTGEEMSLFGIPVLHYDDEMAIYPMSIAHIAKSKNEYFELIESLSAKMKNSFDISLVIKWITFKTNFTTFSIKESYSNRNTSERKFSVFEKIKYKWKTFQIKNKNLSREEKDLYLKNSNLKAVKFINTLLNKKLNSLYEVLPFQKSFKKDDEDILIRYFIDTFYKLIQESFPVEHFEKSLLKKRWDMIKKNYE
jgi:hypothetical protein